MEKRLFLIFNHTFTRDQANHARKTLGVGSIVQMPKKAGEIWGNIPPEADRIYPYLAPVRRWLSESADQGDFVLVQGDFGACFLMVRFAFESGLVPVYSTTRRVAEETVLDDGTVRISHRFKHVIFRRYGR